MDVSSDPDPRPNMVGGGEVVAMIRMTVMIVILLPSLKNPVGKKSGSRRGTEWPYNPRLTLQLTLCSSRLACKGGIGDV